MPKPQRVGMLPQAIRRVSLANLPPKITSLQPPGLHYAFICLKCCSRRAEFKSDLHLFFYFYTQMRVVAWRAGSSSHLTRGETHTKYLWTKKLIPKLHHMHTGFELSSSRGFQICAHLLHSTNIRREVICWQG